MKVWPLRRLVQTTALLSLFAFPALARYSHYAAARQYSKLSEQWHGTPAGALMAATDAVLRLGLPTDEGGVEGRLPRKGILRRTESLYGSPLSVRIFGLQMTDLMAAAESAAASGRLHWTLFIGVLLPLALTLALGRVYCGWICPMGLLFSLSRKMRRILAFLELTPLSVRLSPADKYWILGLGLSAAFLSGLPLLNYLYPPAILGREAQTWVCAFFDAAEGGHHALALAGLTAASLLLISLVVIESALAPGLWCGSLCPGGALYSILGRWRLLRVRREASTCTGCVLCDKACPMGLNPMHDMTGNECDNCGVCLDACPEGSLSYSFSMGSETPKTSPRGPRRKKTAALAAIILALTVSAQAHHIMGLPHYAYDENYPQAPVLKLMEALGPWEVQLTNYPGRPEPGKRTETHIYIRDPRTDAVYHGALGLKASRVRPFGGRDEVYQTSLSAREDSLHKFYPTFPEEGNYELTLTLGEKDFASTLRFAMVVGNPGSPWKTAGASTGLFILLLISVRAVKIKRARRREARS